jgi:hypothetical protein
MVQQNQLLVCPGSVIPMEILATQGRVETTFDIQRQANLIRI